MTMKERILAAFRMIGVGTYKDVVIFLQVKKPKQVLRRISELVKDGLIKETGEKKLTSNGRSSAEYVLVGSIKTDRESKKTNKKRKIKQSGLAINQIAQGVFFK